jgi:hypothetical protein
VTIRYGPGDASNYSNRKLTIFTNGKKSVEIDKGIFHDPCGRFSIPSEGFLLFGGDIPEAEGVCVRYVDFSGQCISDSEVKTRLHSSVYSQWQQEAASSEAQIFAAKSLKPLYKRPPFVWEEIAYISEFGDAMVEGTGLDGASSIFGTLRVLSFVASRMFQEQQGALDMLTPQELQVLESSIRCLEKSSEVARIYQMSQKNPNQFISGIRKFRKILELLEVNECLLVPAAIFLPNLYSPFVIVLDRNAEDTFEVSVVNPGLGSDEYHASSAISQPPKIQTRFVLSFKSVQRTNVLCDGWWLMLWRLGLAPSDANTPDKFYNDLLPLLVGKPLEDAVIENGSHVNDTLSPLRTNERSRLTGYRSCREAWFYYLNRYGVSPSHTLQVLLNYRQQWLKLLLHDLHLANRIEESSIRLVRLGCQQIAHFTSKKIVVGDASRFLTDQLHLVHQTIEGIENRLKEIPILTYGAGTRALSLRQSDALSNPGNFCHRHFERFLRKEDVNGLAGPATQFPPFVPIDFLLVAEQATTFEEALAAIRWTDKICTLLSVQTQHVQNPQFFKVALIQHLFTKILPVPDPTVEGKDFWFGEMRYALQLDVLLLLKRLMEHFASSAFAINTSREFDAVKIVVAGAIVTIGDVFMRKIAIDIPSEASLIWNRERFGIRLFPFDEQSETIITTVPHLNVTQTGILDYWHQLNIDPEVRAVFNWNTSLLPDPATMNYLKLLCQEMGFPYSDQSIMLFLSGEQWLILKNYPEFEYFRDIAFYFKYFLGTRPQAFPPVNLYTQKQAELRWAFQQGQYYVVAFSMVLTCQTKGHRWPSFAIASRFTRSPVTTEDDILHEVELPDFEKKLGQRDSEVLLSALTVPYLRIPIVVSFFATEDRIHALKSTTLQALLDSVVFEPARYLPRSSAYAPEFVPTTDEKCLATPYGLLLNELTCSPFELLLSVIRLMKLALSLDTGSYFASQTDIILYVFRFSCRVDNFTTFLIDYAAGRTHKTLTLRDMKLTQEVAGFLLEKHIEIQQLIEDRFVPMMRRWIRECIDRADALQVENRHDAHKEAEPGSAGASQDDPEVSFNLEQMFVKRHRRKHFRKVGDEAKQAAAADFDSLFQIASNLRSHIVLGMRNVSPSEWTLTKLSRFFSFFSFLMSRHTWNHDLLSVPEPEIFEVYQNLRRELIQRISSLTLNDRNTLLEQLVSVVTDSDRLLISRGWGIFGSETSRHRGRYAVCESSARCSLLSAVQPARSIPYVTDKSDEMGVEVNIQLSQLTLRSNHLEALKPPMSADGDVLTVFGPRSLQCAVVEDATRRKWFRMIGRQHDLQYWDQDDRADVEEFDRDYDPGDMISSEVWIAQLFEPIRLQYFMLPPIPFVLPEKPYSHDDDVAYMMGLHPEQGGNLLEVIFIKSLQQVIISQIHSYGRRFWKMQVYASDARFSLLFLQPTVEDRRSLWPLWGRYEAGLSIPPQLPQPLPSAVLTREATISENLSGTEEMFIPKRFFFGILPSGLLDNHEFWMDDNDVIRGYPTTKDKKTGVYEHVLMIEINPEGKARVSRRPLLSVREQWTESELQELSRTRETTDDETGIYNENGSRRRPSVPSRVLDRGVYDDAAELVLLDSLFASPDSKLRSLARCLVRVETLSHILFWKRASSVGKDDVVDLVELPRLRFSLHEKDGGLYSIDHADLKICDESYLHLRPEVVALTKGIPNSLVFSNLNEEPFIFVSLVRPIRPFIMASPFSTELVMERVTWQHLGTKFLLLPVHVSLSFVQTPTLASALYLLLLRFLARDFVDVQRLVASVGTDTELTEEEGHFLKEVSRVRDSHPDAHAARLHLSLSLTDAPQSVKEKVLWDLPDEMYSYLTKLAYVAMGSRLDRDSEVTALEMAITQIKQEDIIRAAMRPYSQEIIKKFLAYLFDPSVRSEASPQEKERFEKILDMLEEKIETELGVDSSYIPREEIIRLLPKALSVRRSQMMRLTLENRSVWLNQEIGSDVTQKVPTLERSSRWQWWYQGPALAADVSLWSNADMKYNRQRGLSGTQLLQMVNSVILKPESMSGELYGAGFLWLYEMYTGSCKVRVGANDDSLIIALLMRLICSHTFSKNCFVNIFSSQPLLLRW